MHGMSLVDKEWALGARLRWRDRMIPTCWSLESLLMVLATAKAIPCLRRWTDVLTTWAVVLVRVLVLTPFPQGPCPDPCLDPCLAPCLAPCPAPYPPCPCLALALAVGLVCSLDWAAVVRPCYEVGLVCPSWVRPWVHPSAHPSVAIPWALALPWAWVLPSAWGRPSVVEAHS